MKSVRMTTIVATICLTFLAGCQTTSKAKWMDAKPKDMDIDMSLTFFDITEAKKISEGSFVGESVRFKGGFFARYDYHRGYVVDASDQDVVNWAVKIFEGTNPDQFNVQHTKIDVGDIRYVTYNGPKTCLYFRGGAGDKITNRGKRLRKITLEGMYCEDGKVKDLEQVALDQFSKIKLR